MSIVPAAVGTLRYRTGEDDGNIGKAINVIAEDTKEYVNI